MATFNVAIFLRPFWHSIELMKKILDNKVENKYNSIVNLNLNTNKCTLKSKYHF